MKKVVVFGLDDLGELAHFYLTNDSPHSVIAFSVDEQYMDGDQWCGLPVIPFEQIETEFPPDQYAMLVAVGYSKVNRIREEKYNAAKEKGYELISYISSKSTYYGSEVGDNCFIFEDNTIQPFTTIGNNVIMWSGNHLGHHTTVGDHCFLTSHVVISGGVEIGTHCFFGVNATVRDHITIGDRNVIGMGAVLVQDAEPGGVYTGNPATRRAQKSASLKKL